MLKQGTDTTGDGGYKIPEAKLPSWLSGLNDIWSFAVWLYRYEDASSTFRNIFTLDGGANDYLGIRMSNSALAARLRVNGVSYDLRQTGGSGNLAMVHSKKTLLMGYFDPSGLNVDIKLFAVQADSTDPTASGNSIFPASPPLSADLGSSGDLEVMSQYGALGANLWYGLMGGIAFWKDIKIDSDDVTAVWNSNNPQPWTVAATGNLPGVGYDGLFVLPHCPGGNTRPRGGSNVTGPMMGDAISGDEDILVFRQETGITDTGVIHVHETGLTFPTPAAPMTFTNAFRSSP